MSGMVSEGRKRDWRITPFFMQDWNAVNDTNTAADEIIASPDRYLLSQSQVFEAEGGWGTCALTLGLGAVGIAGVLSMNGPLSSYLGRGQLRAREWLSIGTAAWLCGAAGQEAGIQIFGNPRAYQNHWLAYTYIKS